MFGNVSLFGALKVLFNILITRKIWNFTETQSKFDSKADFVISFQSSKVQHHLLTNLNHKLDIP